MLAASIVITRLATPLYTSNKGQKSDIILQCFT
jgi:hypothetical protein